MFEFETFNNTTGVSELDNCFWIKSYNKNKNGSRVIAINDNNDLILCDQINQIKNDDEYDTNIQKLKLQLWSAEEVRQPPFRCNLIESRMKTLTTRYYEVQDKIDTEIDKLNSNLNNKNDKFNLEDININSTDDSSVDWENFKQ